MKATITHDPKTNALHVGYEGEPMFMPRSEFTEFVQDCNRLIGSYSKAHITHATNRRIGRMITGKLKKMRKTGRLFYETEIENIGDYIVLK